MNNKAFTISIALAGFAVFMIYSYITSKEQEIKATYGTPTPVVVATRDIGPLNEVFDNMVEIVSRPKQFIEPGHTDNVKQVVGFVTSVPIRKGEQITLNKIVALGVQTGLSRQVTPGKRALSVSVDDVSGVNRLLKPGDRIDIIATIDPPGSQRGGQISKLILQDVPVLAVGEYVTNTAPRKIEKDDVTGKNNVRNLNIDRNFNTITVEVSPNEAMQLTILRDTQQRLSVMLRNSDDTERLNMAGMGLLDALGQDASRALRTPAANQR
jgi:pilus assembly protein CpaB